MTRLTALLLTFGLAAGMLPVPAAAHAPAHRACSAASVLNDVGNALTGGSDATVLEVALAGEHRLLACDDTRDAIGAELIAADAYGDVNEPKRRCSALGDARMRATSMGDSARARLIGTAMKGCR